MSKFKVGDRVAVYLDGNRCTGQLKNIIPYGNDDPSDTFVVRVDNSDIFIWGCRNDCRKLVKKKKPTIDKVITQKEFDNYKECVDSDLKEIGNQLTKLNERTDALKEGFEEQDSDIKKSNERFSFAHSVLKASAGNAQLSRRIDMIMEALPNLIDVNGKLTALSERMSQMENKVLLVLTE